ncbi:TonB C-terminal domain-containing protein [Candidatus Dependentiae bacterium]|nr:TonB C-terminal domain-containing protein [Candidatus Dependentiae bacterium]MBU4387556.1 TonB C-terminal domain-containing protein [Candidatus Dependentiae bacterium]MCG2756631.1 TonB C-terminal domain-containing protein [Candidatus Dependentiae bacterium]
MKNKLTRNYLIGSAITHLIIILIALFATHSNKKINKQFLVFGAHSKRQSLALFKSHKDFTQTDWYAKRLSQESKARKTRIERKNKIKNNKKKLLQEKTRTKASTNNLNKKNNTSFKEEIKKEKKLPKKQKLAEKIIEQKQEPAKKIEPEVISQKIEQPKDIESENIEQEQQLLQDQPDDEMQINLLGEDDQEIIKYQESIQKEVSRLWHPPIGVPKGSECIVRFYIDNSGNVEKYEIMQKSNILIYDLSITQVAKKFKFEESLWGKNFSIHFRQ